VPPCDSQAVMGEARRSGVKVISPGMFQALGTALVAGRDFTWTDLYDIRDVAVVSENLAREL
jgi:hypothetical protein